jgi:hypothetical protein
MCPVLLTRTIGKGRPLRALGRMFEEIVTGPSN